MGMLIVGMFMGVIFWMYDIGMCMLSVIYRGTMRMSVHLVMFNGRQREHA